MRSILLLVFSSYITFVDCIIPLNILLSIIDQFRLINIMIQKDCFALSVKRELFKIFSDHGEMINLNDEIGHTKHSIIRCTETIKNLTFDKSIKTKTVVISQIETENYLNEIDISIGEEVYFLDKNTFKIYEAYTINNVHVIRYLGQFYKIDKDLASFSPPDDFVNSFVDRRRDFHGIQLIGMTETWPPYIIIPDNYADHSNYFPENETYDITNIVSGSYIDALNHLEKSLNFSIKLYKRLDGIWGVPKTLPNGTMIFNGMMESLAESHVDMICASFSLIPSRYSYVDYLLPMTQSYPYLFIAKNNDIIDWTVYLTPFSIRIWLIILASAITIIIIITVMEKQYNIETVSYRQVNVLVWVVDYFNYLGSRLYRQFPEQQTNSSTIYKLSSYIYLISL